MCKYVSLRVNVQCSHAVGTLRTIRLLTILSNKVSQQVEAAVQAVLIKKFSQSIRYKAESPLLSRGESFFSKFMIYFKTVAQKY